MKLRVLSVGIIFAIAWMLVACEPQVVEVTREVEVTRVVERVETLIQEIEVTRVVLEPVTDLDQFTTIRPEGGPLVIESWEPVTLLNPYGSIIEQNLNASALVLEPLARIDNLGNLVPVLAEEIPTVENGGVSGDFQQITWKLRDNVVWSDGTPLTTQDVRFTADYCLNPETECLGLDEYDHVVSVDILGDNQIQITFDEPQPFPYTLFVGQDSPIIQELQFETCLSQTAATCTSSQAPVGTGPYVLSELSNDEILFARNELFRDLTRPYFTEVLILNGGSQTTAIQSIFELNTADYAWNIEIDETILSQSAATPDGFVVEAFGSCVDQLAINLTDPQPEAVEDRSEFLSGANPNPVLSNPAVREAIYLAIDRDQIARRSSNASSQPVCNLVNAPQVYASLNNVSCLDSGTLEAIDVLDQAEVLDTDGDGIREINGVPIQLQLQYPDTPYFNTVNEQIISDLLDIGIETQSFAVAEEVYFSVNPNETQTFNKFYADLQLFEYCAATPDPQVFLEQWTTDNITGSLNRWQNPNVIRYSDPFYDGLVSELEDAELSDRPSILIQMNDKLISDHVLIPLVSRGQVSAHSESLLGIRMNDWDVELWNVADWARGSN